ncbi:MAG: hypothetical protein QMD05_03450 [Candidatus Brocadiaceae bacterium]|nr:hypothetical protein [Candidatus Brocadiaceae bacterium]
MIKEDLFKYLRGFTKGHPFTASSLKEIAIRRGYSEEDAEDTVKYLEEYEKALPWADITKGKMAGMIAVTLLTPFIGLLNLIFLWRDKSQRIRSIIALAGSLTLTILFGTVPLTIVFFTFFPLPLIFFPHFFNKSLYLYQLSGQLSSIATGCQTGLVIWMVVEAIKAYQRSAVSKLGRVS